MRGLALAFAVLGTLLAVACGAAGQPAPAATGANAAAGAATSATTCPSESDPLIWGGDRGGLRLLVMDAGTEHRDEAVAAATAWGDDEELGLQTTSLPLYGSAVPTREIAGRIVGDPQPDVVEGFVGGALLACAQEGRLADLTDLWEANGWDEVVPATVTDLATVDGRRYFAPTTMQWNPIWHRPDLFAELDLAPPATWDELLQACDVLNDAGITPISLGTSTWTPPVARWFSHINLGLNGPDFHQRLLAGLESWDDPRIAAVFDRWEQLLDRDCFGDDVTATSYADMVDAVAAGDAGMLDLGAWIHESLEPEESELLAPFSFPVLDADVPRTEIVTVQGGFVPAGSTRPGQARELLVHLAGPERLQASHDRLGRTVVRTDVDPGLDQAQQHERDAIAEADRLVQLLEFSAEDRYANAILGALVGFVGTPESRPTLLERVESTRRDVFGATAGPVTSTP